MSANRILAMLVCSFCLLTSLCHADEVKFATSNTFGCFTSTTCNPTSNTATTSAGDLSFLGTSFGQPNGISTTNGSLNFVLGQFTLTDKSTTFIDKDFYSTITFTLPVAISGGQTTSKFNAEVLGVVKADQFGAVYIDFDTTPQHFTFSNNTYTGSFDFNVSTLLFGTWGSGQTSNSANWYGEITNAVQTPRGSTPPPMSAPEPGSLALLGSGLLFIGSTRKRLLR